MKVFFLIFSLFSLLSLPAVALEENAYYDYDPVIDEVPEDEMEMDDVGIPPDFVLDNGNVLPGTLEGEEGVPVYIISSPEGEAYPDLYASNAPELSIGTNPPDDSPFFGSGWITGTDSRLGTVTLYFPIDYQTGTFGVDSNGYLFNVTSSTVSGYLGGVYNNSVSCSAFDYPRYRDGSSGDWTYYDLHLTPTDSNMEIALDHVPRVPVFSALPFVVILLLGGVLLCCMKRS